MTEEAKRDWFAIAWDSLKGIPIDLLQRGCLHARRHADHPSKIVPLIMREIEDDWQHRKRFEREWSQDQIEGPRPKPHIADRDRRTFTASDWAELNEYLESMGSPVRYRADGTKFEHAP